MATPPKQSTAGQISPAEMLRLQQQGNLKEPEPTPTRTVQAVNNNQPGQWVDIGNGRTVLTQSYKDARAKQEAEMRAGMFKQPGEAGHIEQGTTNFFGNNPTGANAGTTGPLTSQNNQWLSPDQLAQQQIAPQQTNQERQDAFFANMRSGTTARDTGGELSFGSQATEAANRLLAGQQGGTQAGAPQQGGPQQGMPQQGGPQQGAQAITQTGAPVSTQQTGQVYTGGQALEGEILSPEQMYQDQLARNDQYAQMSQQMNEQQFAVAEEARRKQLMSALAQTNAAGQFDLSKLSIQELENIATSQGLSLSDAEKERIRAGGLAQIENIKMEQSYLLTQIQLTEEKLEREFQRRLTAQEQVNAQNDATMRRLANRYGGGGEDIVSNVAVMETRNKGESIVRDMVADYENFNMQVQNEVKNIVQTATANINNIEQAMSEMENERFMMLQESVNEYINLGVSNFNDLNTLMREDMKRYFDDINTIQREGLKMFQEQERFAWSQQMEIVKFEAEQFWTGKGYEMDVAKFEQSVTQFGMEYAMREAQFDFEQKKFVEGVRQYEKNYGLDVAKFNQNVQQFGMEYALKEASFNLDYQLAMNDEERKQFAMDTEKVAQGIASSDILKKYLKPEDVIFGGVYIENNQPIPLAKKIAGAIEKASKSKDPAYQCVQFVRDILGDLPGGLFSLTDKVNNLIKSSGGKPATAPPTVGSAVILDWQRPQDKGKSPDQYPGHIAYVKSVNTKKGTFTILEYNGAGGAYALGEREISMKDPRVKGYWESQNVKTPQPSVFTPEQQQAQQFSAFMEDKFRSGDIVGAMRATAGGSQPTNTERTMLADARGLTQSLDQLESMVADIYREEGGTGAIAGRFREWNPMSSEDEKLVVLEAQLNRIIPKLARGAFGEVGVLTDADMRRYANTLPNIRTTEDANKLLVMATKDILARNVINQIDTMARSNVDVSLFTDVYEEFGKAGANFGNQDPLSSAREALNNL